MPPQKHMMSFPHACWAVWCWGGFLTAKSVVAPLPGKALPPLGSSSSWEKITQISVGCLGPEGRQGYASAPWGWGYSQRTPPSLLALGEGSELGLWEVFPCSSNRRRQICLKYDDKCLKRQGWVRWCFGRTLACCPSSNHSDKCVSWHIKV